MKIKIEKLENTVMALETIIGVVTSDEFKSNVKTQEDEDMIFVAYDKYIKIKNMYEKMKSENVSKVDMPTKNIFCFWIIRRLAPIFTFLLENKKGVM